MIQKGSFDTAPALQLRRRRPEIIALAFVLWTSAAWVIATPGALDRFGTLKGTDFAQFYVSARLVATGRAGAMYDWSAYTHELASQVPGPEGLLYLPVYPPVLGALLAPLGTLQYLPALTTWTVVSAVLYAGSVLLLVALSPGLRRDPVSAALAAVGFPAFQQLLLYGQISAIALCLVALAWFAWRDGHRTGAGLALGALVFKPQMLAIAISAVLLAPSWALLAGIAAGVAIELGLAALVLGPQVYVGYADTLQRVLANPGAFEPKADQIQSLRGFFLALGGHNLLTTALFLAASAIVLLLAARAVRRAATSDLTFAIVVMAGLLVNPHLYPYDLVVLLVPLALTLSWLGSASVEERTIRRIGGALLIVYWLPLVAPALGVVHVQLMAPAMTWLLWTLYRDARAQPTAHP